MLRIPVKEGENIERSIKKFKKKFERTGALKELRARKNFSKPTIKKREIMLEHIIQPPICYMRH